MAAFIVVAAVVVGGLVMTTGTVFDIGVVTVLGIAIVSLSIVLGLNTGRYPGGKQAYMRENLDPRRGGPGHRTQG